MVVAAAERMLDDLLSIEVNTIVKPGMTGRKMPAVGHALLDVFSGYDIWLCEHSGRLNAAWAAFPRRHKDAFLIGVERKGERDKWWIVGDDGSLIDQLDVGGLFDPAEEVDGSDFETLRRRARMAEELHRVMAGGGHPVEVGSAIILQRIIRNCDQRGTILNAHGVPGSGGPETGGRRSAALVRSAPDGVAAAGEMELTSKEMVVVRKVWELGTETIVMQTVVQLDGDVVTRIDEARTSADHQALRDLHRQSVDTTLGHWRSLVDTVLRMATNLVRGSG